MAYENDATAAEDSAKPSAGGVQYVEAGEGDAGQRLDNFLGAGSEGVPRTHVYRLLRKGEVRVNSKRAKPEQRVEAGDRIRLPPVRRPEPAPEAASGPRARRCRSSSPGPSSTRMTTCWCSTSRPGSRSTAAAAWRTG